jgi:lipopolysaccharide/colanic/teichoic acid biosynthesis glycosyltransferase
MGGSRWLHSPAKRAFDIVAAGGALVLVSPIIAVTAVLVRLRLGSPVLFRQERAGVAGQPFHVVKFRTMTHDHDRHGELLSDAERLPPFGRWLRATSLDELPQLWSVVRGDMSLIGPRPLPTKYVARYSPQQRRRLEAIPGVTGWAQVQGRNAIAWPEKLAFDVWYVDHASWRLDAKIVLLTVKAVFGRGGVTADGHVTMPEFTGET